MSYSLIDLSENAQDNRYPITNDFGLLYIAKPYTHYTMKTMRSSYKPSWMNKNH